MLKLILTIFIYCFCLTEAYAEHVNGYTKKNGTYVAPYERSKANNTVYDNYSTKGNFNPYTGEEGKKDPEYLLNQKWKKKTYSDSPSYDYNPPVYKAYKVPDPPSYDFSQQPEVPSYKAYQAPDSPKYDFSQQAPKFEGLNWKAEDFSGPGDALDNGFQAGIDNYLRQQQIQNYRKRQQQIQDHRRRQQEQQNMEEESLQWEIVRRQELGTQAPDATEYDTVKETNLAISPNPPDNPLSSDAPLFPPDMPEADEVPAPDAMLQSSDPTLPPDLP